MAKGLSFSAGLVIGATVAVLFSNIINNKISASTNALNVSYNRRALSSALYKGDAKFTGSLKPLNDLRYPNLKVAISHVCQEHGKVFLEKEIKGFLNNHIPGFGGNGKVSKQTVYVLNENSHAEDINKFQEHLMGLASRKVVGAPSGSKKSTSFFKVGEEKRAEFEDVKKGFHHWATHFLSNGPDSDESPSP